MFSCKLYRNNLDSFKDYLLEPWPSFCPRANQTVPLWLPLQI